MSGLLGVWNSQSPVPWKQMLDDLQVLGPNGGGDWHGLNGQLSLGRTQFFDTPESQAEPPVIEYAGCVLVWEGRLDDRDSLLTSHSGAVTDGQLLIESYRRWGIDCIDRLIGEFVFILWDAANDLLLVGCDPVGKYTVAYTWDGQTLLISSRVLTLLLHPNVSRELDPLYLANTLCDLQGQEPGSTPFHNIKRLLPGSALILKAGKMQLRQIATLNFPERYDVSRSPESYYEEFWNLLNISVKDRLRTIYPTCTTLSGGLDSTTITVSLLNHLPMIDAFSTVTSIYPEFDECEPIETFLARYPQTKWHPVNSDHVWSLSEPWEKLPATDDPLVVCTMSINLHLMEQIQQQGFGLIFDGEWGDEICNVSFSDLVRFGRWRKAYEYIKHKKRWPSFLWRELALPRLPAYYQRQWFAWRYSDTLPVYITPEYAESTYTKIAIDRNYKSINNQGLQQSISWAAASGFSVASNCAFSLMQASMNLKSTSPLQDRRLMEFAISIPPELQADPQHGKIFLRQVNQGYLPSQILWRPKNNYFDPVKYVGIGKGLECLELLEKLKEIDCLIGIVDIDRTREMLLGYRTGFAGGYCSGHSYRNDEANYLYQLFAFVNWHQRMTKYVSSRVNYQPYNV
jgi:asparagine synthase (glutamine-hydrolysing)